MQVKYKNRPPQNPFIRENYLVQENSRKRPQEAEPVRRSNQFDLRSYAERYHPEPELVRSQSAAANDVVLRALQSVNPFKTPKRLKDIVRQHEDEYHAVKTEPRAYSTRSVSKENYWRGRSAARSFATEEVSFRESRLQVKHLTPYMPTSPKTGPYFPPVYQPNVNMSPNSYYHLLGSQLPSIHTPSFLDADHFQPSYTNQYSTIPGVNNQVYVHPSSKSLKKGEKPAPTKRHTPPVESTRKVVGYESDDSGQQSPYRNPNKNGVFVGGTFKKTQQQPSSQPSIVNQLNYESDPDNEESPEHPPVIRINGKEYFSVNLLKK